MWIGNHWVWGGGEHRVWCGGSTGCGVVGTTGCGVGGAPGVGWWGEHRVRGGGGTDIECFTFRALPCVAKIIGGEQVSVQMRTAYVSKLRNLHLHAFS